MEKFASRRPGPRWPCLRLLAAAPLLIVCMAGCTSTQNSGYISRADHPYSRKFNAGYEKVVSSIVYVLKKKGWVIDSEANPSVYERDERYDNNGFQNLLIITETRKNILQTTRMRLNILVHAFDSNCDVEIRYEAVTPMIKQFVSTRNDRMVQELLDAVGNEVHG